MANHFTTRQGDVKLVLSDGQYFHWVKPALVNAGLETDLLDFAAPEPDIDTPVIRRLDALSQTEGPAAVFGLMPAYADMRMTQRIVHARSKSERGTRSVPAWKLNGGEPTGFSAEEAQVLADLMGHFRGEDPYGHIAAYRAFCRQAAQLGGFIAA